MSNALRHPEGEVLLRYADGELPARQARKVRSHLESCWQCRTELEDMQSVVGECVRYRQNVLQPLLPPPAPWRDLFYQFDEIDASLERRSWLARLRRPILTWAPVAAALAIAAIAYNHLHNAPAVEAAALLRKAVAAADAAPSAAPRQIRIRTKQRTMVRPIALVTSVETGPLEPLSVRSYQQWHDGLAQKHDSVETAGGNYAIHTSTESGELAEATLQLRTTDLHPVQERIEFRNHDWVEIEEIPALPEPPSAVVASNSVHPPVSISVPDAPKSSDQFRQPAPAATVGDELNVLVALHNLGADLGDPVNVKRQSGRILVAGVGVDPERRRQIEQALGARPNVDLQFSDQDAAASQPEKPVRGDVQPNAEISALQARIQKQAGGRADYENLTTQALDFSESMMARAWALRRLAERFPAGASEQMTAADRQALHDLYRSHAAALAQTAVQMERLLKPVLAPLGGKANRPPLPSAESWQAGTENLFTIGRRVDTLLAVILGVAPGEAARDLPTQVLSSLAQLRSSAEAYAPAGPSGESKP
jgi:anti-sigma factor RsiW